jgi:hypothetical protein
MLSPSHDHAVHKTALLSLLYRYVQLMVSGESSMICVGRPLEVDVSILGSAQRLEITMIWRQTRNSRPFLSGKPDNVYRYGGFGFISLAAARQHTKPLVAALLLLFNCL